ncbi:MAG: 16S rRNA (adenine(1518)-N(6)/adenine(1519)-N(6))-dimethyltransferase RsmA [Rhodothermaceae bacterium]|nr:16S rRNA (adenine(1518)-N(6)/adenine(1519)-N(6))-dimethyltransferase RsmA [Rhodothermaceae bacterium]
MARVSPKKSLGQHFLKDSFVRDKIIDALQATRDDWVVEIGPGTGAMTGILKSRYPDFEAIELDQRAIAALEEKYPGIRVHHADVVRFDWAGYAERAGKKLHIVGNLPYYITSQILFDLIAAHDVVEEAVVMMQLEVAQRLVAKPRTKSYGILSVLIQRYTEPELLFNVSRDVFYPKPAVESAVVRLVFRKEPEGMDRVSHRLFKRVVKASFNQRRKKLKNSLKSLLSDTNGTIPEQWEGARAEELTPSDFLTLTRHLFDIDDT